MEEMLWMIGKDMCVNMICLLQGNLHYHRLNIISIAEGSTL